MEKDVDTHVFDIDGNMKQVGMKRVVLGVISIFLFIGFVMAASAVHQVSTLRGQLSERTQHVSRVISFRLLPNEDLVAGVMKVVNENGLKSAWIISCVGSLTHYNIRYANQPDGAEGDGHFEIVSLVGTMTVIPTVPPPPAPSLAAKHHDAQEAALAATKPMGAWHMHISIGDGTGRTISGHLLLNSTIFTTAEIQIGFDCDVEYYRAVDGSTPWDELQIRNAKWC